jgi:hypothetical protein
MLVPTTQPRQCLDALLRVPDLDVLHVQPHFHGLANQTARHGVGVPLHMEQTPRIHLGLHTLARFQPPRGQAPQQAPFLGQTLQAAGIELHAQLPQIVRIGLTAGKIPAATQQQRLLQRLREAVVTLLDIAVLVRLPRLDLLADQIVMRQQALVTLRERPAVAHVVDCRTQAIGAMTLGRAAQFPQGILQAFAEALETLGEADGHGLPVRVGQHKVVDQVVETLSRQGHSQVGQIGEVRGREPAGLVDLGKEDFLGPSRRGPPAAYVPLQRPQLRVCEAAGITALQVRKDGFGLQTRIEFEQVADLGPNVLEGIDPGRPGMRLSNFAGLLAEPPVFACRLLVHVGLRCRLRQRPLVVQKTNQFPYLCIRDHRKPPWDRDLR